MSGLMQLRNLWHDPHAKRTVERWTSENVVTPSQTEDGHWSYSSDKDAGTINPFGTNSNISDVVPGMSVICAARFSTGTWPLNAKGGQQVLFDGSSTGLWVIRLEAQNNPVLWYPCWWCRSAEPLTILGLAVYTPETWAVIEQAWTAGLLATPIISYDLMPYPRG